MKNAIKRGISGFVLALVSLPALAQEIRVVSWNVESGGADPATVSDRIEGMDGFDLWGFSEVQHDSWTAQFEVAAEDGENANFSRITGTTGGADRLAIVYDSDRFQLVGHQELHQINNGNHRSPLVAHLKIKSTGQEFLFMVNHLARSNQALRHQQASQLNTWATTQSMPVIAVGDFNFDWHATNGDNDHDAGYDNMTANGVWKWVRPNAPLVKTQDSNFNSVLDFVFLAKADGVLSGQSTIIVKPNDFPDDQTTPDHRPVVATLSFSGSGRGPTPVGPAGTTVTKQMLLERIEAMEQELTELRQLVEQMP